MSSIPRHPRRTSPPRGAGAVASLLWSSRLVALGLIVVGVMLVLGAVFADPLGISGGGEGFGWKQLIATIAGLILAVLGAGLLLQGLVRDAREPLEPLDAPE